MDCYGAFTTLLSALAGAAWWSIGRALRATFRYGDAPAEGAQPSG